MGVVYKATQLGLNRTVALKMILGGAHAGQDHLHRFRVEGEAIARLQHPNIVQVYAVGEHEDLPYFAMEYMTGGSLAKRLRGDPLPPREAAELIETLARATHHAHEHGIIHRDLKPANILLGNRQEAAGNRQTDTKSSLLPIASVLLPKITDFGLAKDLDAATLQTQSGAVLGTPSYMAPEQAAGRTRHIGPHTDVYSLGVILYEMLTGRVPFKGFTPAQVIEQVCNDDPVPVRRRNRQTPRDLETICLKCLTKDPAKRYASAADLADDLRRFLDGEPIRARPPNRILAVSRTAGVGLLCGLAAWLLAPLPLMNRIEPALLRLHFAVRGERPSAAPIVIVGVDDAFLDKLRKPLPQLSPELAKVVEFLDKQGAAAIGLDLMTPANLAAHPDLQAGGPGDATTLGAAIQKSGKVVLTRRLRPDATWILPLPQWLLKNTLDPDPNDLGFADVEPDADMRLYRQRVMLLDADEPVLSLAMAMLCKARRSSPTRDEHGQPAIGGDPAPVDEEGKIFINYVGPPGHFRVTPFGDVLAAVAGNAPQQPLPSFSGAMVLIGNTARSGDDYYHHTVYSEVMAGVEVQANILATMADGAYLQTPWWMTPLPWALLAGAVLGWLCPRLSPIAAIGVVLALQLAWWGWAQIAFTAGYWLVDQTPMLLTGLLCLGATVLLRKKRRRLAA
jgi:CHASE2 domain-containing sensor protein